MRIAYFVHDVQDAAVVRRTGLLRDEGLEVTVAGFRRRALLAGEPGRQGAVDLGLTRDGRLLRRVLSVLGHVLRPGRIAAVAAGADVLVARNLEMLVLARRVRRPGQRLVYECLDIHRLLLGMGPASRLLHRIEDWALQGTDLLVISAPAFLNSYFRARRGYRGAALLVENKVPAAEARLPAPARPPAPAGGRPWVIGWFGMLRCQRTLEMLGRLAAGSGGRIEVVIAGIPSAAVFPDFAAQVAAMPGLRYLGPYTKADLPRLYGQIHFVWAIDYFEEGLNSAWLLPNRLYEGLAHGAVPLALGDVATGSWLHRHGAGLLLGAPAADLPARLQALDAAGLARLRAEVDAIPDEAIWQTAAERAAIASAICGAAAAATTPARLEVAA